MEMFWVLNRLVGGSYRVTQRDGHKQVSKPIQIFLGYTQQVNKNYVTTLTRDVYLRTGIYYRFAG